MKRNFHLSSVVSLFFILLMSIVFTGCGSEGSAVAGSGPEMSEEATSSENPDLSSSSASIDTEVEAEAHFLPVQNTYARVSHPYKTALAETWAGMKARNIDPYGTGLVHRPWSEMPGDAVSEGVGYGMILALYSNDQEYFNKIWDAGETYMWQGGYYNWRVSESGATKGTGAATDAEEDIAAMLIFADRLVQAGIWEEHTSPQGVSYAERAQNILDNMWALDMIDGYHLAPGAGWGGKEFVNPGYFAPAFYKIFKEFDANNHDWDGLIDQCYTTLENSPGAALGLVPDWMTPSGSYVLGGLGYNPFDGGKSMYKDAIRVLWRLANDAVWFQEPRAIAFLQKSFDFIEAQGGPEAINFFDMAGNPVSADSLFIFNAGEKSRPRSELSHLTVGMWSLAAMGLSAADGDVSRVEPYSEKLLSFWAPDNYYWGHAVDPLGGIEDIEHNELYFDQFLAWFGASILSGTFVNILEVVDP